MTKRTAATTTDFEALIALGAAAAGGTVVVRCSDDEDASFFLEQVREWAQEMNFPATRDRTWRLQIGKPTAPVDTPNFVGTIETAPHDYPREPSMYRGGELIRDLPPLPKEAVRG